MTRTLRDSVAAVLSGEKILITGPAGQIAFPLARYLAADNEVWGIARFSDADEPGRRSTRSGSPPWCATSRPATSPACPTTSPTSCTSPRSRAPGLDFDHAITVNAEGTGLLLAHCRNAKAALVMSTHSVYRPTTTRCTCTWRPTRSVR